jgi:hypothetical protein
MIKVDNRTRASRSIFAGIFLVAIGGLYAAHLSNVDLPDWLFTWPMGPLAAAIFLMLNFGIRFPIWVFPASVGILGMLHEEFPQLNFFSYIGPLFIIIVGLWFLLRRNFLRTAFDAKSSTMIFGGIKKRVISKDFKGTHITCIFGGAEIDLSQADIHGNVVLDVNLIAGGAKLIVPMDWQIKNEMKLDLGMVEDKRSMRGSVVTDANKVLVLTGTLMGGIEIRSI